MMTVKKLLLFVLLATSLSGLFSAQAHAQTSIQAISLSVYPSSFDLHAKPGDTVNDKFRVKNNTNQTLQLMVMTKKLVTDPNSGQPVPIDPTKEDTYISWVKFDKPDFTALPQEWTDIPFTITIPKDSAFGYYYVFEIKQQDEIKPSGNGAVVQGRVSIAALLTVDNAKTTAVAKMVDFKPQSMVNEYLPVTFEATIQNTGNVHVRPRGNIFIRGLGDKDLATIEVNETHGAVLPNGKRTYTADWRDGFLVNEPVMEDGKQKTDSNGKPVTHLVVNWNKLTDFRFGKYTATLFLVYDTGKRDETLEATTSFWVIPWKALLIVIAGILLVVFIIRTILRAYIAKELKRKK
jgi:hypothetical protein